MTQPTTTATAGAPAPGRPARADTARPDCRHWIGDERRYCRTGSGVRQFAIGHRCPAHTPAAIAGKAEPQPGPGWPAHQEAA